VYAFEKRDFNDGEISCCGMKKLTADDMHDHSEPGMGRRKLGLYSAMGTVCPVKGCFSST